MTDLQLKLLKLIDKWIRETGEAPLHRELSKDMGFKWESKVQPMLVDLKELGMIDDINGRSRSIKLTAKGLIIVGEDFCLCPACGHTFKHNLNMGKS